MSFFFNHTTKTAQKEIIDNTADNKVIVITNMRVINTADTPYTFSLFIRDPEGTITPLSVDELDPGDYIVDSTIFELNPKYALLDMANVDTVKVAINGHKKPFEKE